MLDKSDELINNVKDVATSDDELLMYGSDLEELEELKALDEQFQKTAIDLDKAKDQLRTIEFEIKKSREDELAKKDAVNKIFKKASEKEKNGLLEEALDIYLEILEYDSNNARAKHHIDSIKLTLEEKKEEEKRIIEEKKRKAGKVQELFQKGRKYYIDNQFEKALESFTEALSINGMNAEISEFIDRTEKRIQEIEEAMNNARRDAEDRQKRVHELLIKSKSKLRAEDYLSAITLLEDALIIMPDNKEVQELIRQYEKKYNEKQEADKRYAEEKLARDKEYLSSLLEAEDLLIKKMYQQSIVKLDEMLLKYPDKSDEISKLSFQAKDQLFIMEKDEKDKVNSRVRDERDREAFLKDNYGKGLGFYTVKDYEKAAHYFSLVLTQDPHYEDVSSLMQRIEENLDYLTKKREDEKKEVRKIELENDQIKISEKKLKEEKLKERFQGALKFIREDRFEEAVSLLEKCYTEEPENEVYLRELDFARKELRHIREKKAEEEAASRKMEEEKIKENNLLQLYCEKAEKFFEGGFIEEARKEWEKSLTINPAFQRARNGLIKYHEEYKRRKELKNKEQEERKNKQIKIEKLNFEARLAFEKREIEKALEIWQSVMAIDPYNEEAKSGALDAGSAKTLISQYNDSKAVIERRLIREERKIKEVRDDIVDAEKFFLEGDYKKACSMLNDLLQYNSFGTEGL